MNIATGLDEPLFFRCPRCEKTFDSETALIGETHECPFCHRPVFWTKENLVSKKDPDSPFEGICP